MPTYTHSTKRGERYRIAIDDDHDSMSEALREIGRWASNCELGFTWYDAAILSQRIRWRFCDERFQHYRALVTEL